MGSSPNSYVVFKPGRQAAITYLWDFVPLAGGTAVLVFFHKSGFQIVGGVLLCLWGLWQILTTRNVLRTHFVLTESEIMYVSPSSSSSLQWTEITSVVIRQRPAGLQPGRPDRLVILTSNSGRKLGLNTSVLYSIDEKRMLEEIIHRVQCPVEEVIDGPFILKKNKEKGKNL